MKETIKQIIYKLNYSFIMKNYILLESNPDLSDNTMYVYQEMLNRGLEKQYKFIWFCNQNHSKEEKKNYPNTIFINRSKKIRILYYRLISKYIIDCNIYIHKLNHNQKRIHLTHASQVKIVDYMLQCGKIDYYVALSEYWKTVIEEYYHDTKLIDNIIVTGFPRNDTIFRQEQQYSLLNNIKRNKTILWLPTYRQHSVATDDFSKIDEISFPYGIPCFDSINDFETINKILLKNNILLIIKSHPAQDLKYISKINYSNIKIIDNSYFKKGTTLYNYLSKIDALITDYSSIYFDYLLCNKPIGLAIPDKDIYLKHVKQPFMYEDGFVGEYIYNNNDLKKFILNIVENKDIKQNARNKIIKTYHKYTDGNSSKRIVNLFEKIASGEK